MNIEPQQVLNVDFIFSQVINYSLQQNHVPVICWNSISKSFPYLPPRI